MEEVEVVKKTFDYLTEKANFSLWVDNHSAYSKLHPKDYPRHKITIKGFIPDIIGYNNLNEVIAIEVKGKKDLQKGLGQAIIYKSGANHSYLAAYKPQIKRISDALYYSNIGGILVDEEVEITHPMGQFQARFLPDIERELLLLRKSDEASSNRLTDLKLNYVINYLAPLVYVNSDGVAEDELLNKLSDYDISKSRTLVKGALNLGLIKKIERKYVITDEGFLFKSLLRFNEKLSLEGLIKIKSEMKAKRDSTLYTVFPELAISLRMLYNNNEMFVEFMKIFEIKEKQKIPFQEIIEEIVKEKPNLFLNFVCPRRKKEVAMELYRNGEESEIYENKDLLRGFLSYSIVFTLKKHLIDLGILSPKNTLFNTKMKDYEPEKDYWILL